MKKFALPIVFLLIASSSYVLATSPNTAILDAKPTEYDATDNWGVFQGGAGQLAPDSLITNVFVTWDATYLYVALQGWGGNDKLAVMIDVDPSNAVPTGATATTDWTGVGPSYVRYNDLSWQAATNGRPFGADYMIASEGFFNNVLRIEYDGDTLDSNKVSNIFDVGNGATPQGTAIDMVVDYMGDVGCDLQGFEARIPWTEVYNSNRLGVVGGSDVVPTNAMLRLFANIHNNDPDSGWSSSDVIPLQVSSNAAYAGGLLTTADYVDIPVDQDGDGMPDLQSGDVNAPFIKSASGAQTKRIVYALWNEDVIASSVTNPASWMVNGGEPELIEQTTPNTVLITLTNDLPAYTNLVTISVAGVEDSATNSKTARLCFYPASSGIETAVTVRFVMESSSGLGLTPGASAFHINGSNPPLEWGYPPATSMALEVLSGSLYYKDITFPPGSPQVIYYKYSGLLNNTGTNNFEMIRLADYKDASREITLNLLGDNMVVTDYLGAVAHPWRDTADTNSDAYADIYDDIHRGDAGVRERRTITFQVDLTARDLYGYDRVILQGSDPLRGFNENDGGVKDWAGESFVGWDVGGLEMYDDGTHGDTNAADGIYARLWSFTTDGLDSAIVEASPWSLVGGGNSTDPYNGFLDWIEDRSPKSFTYRFFIADTNDSSYVDSPKDVNFSYFIEDSDPMDVVLDPYVWENGDLPFKNTENPAVITDIEHVGTDIVVTFTNIALQMEHGAVTATDIDGPWNNYGASATGSNGNWQTAIPAGEREFVQIFTGPGAEPGHVYWTPASLPETGGTVRIWYNQIGRVLSGLRDVSWYGSPSWTPMPMTFLSNGVWMIDVILGPGTNTYSEFLFTDAAPPPWDKNGGEGGPNYNVNVGNRATWSPDPVTNGGVFTITYNTTNSPLAGESNVYFHGGFDGWEGGGWQDVQETPRPAMTNIGSDLWTISVVIPSNRTMTVNWVFTSSPASGSPGNWDNNSSHDWSAFIGDW